jgi:signal transduction histidine kinase
MRKLKNLMVRLSTGSGVGFRVALLSASPFILALITLVVLVTNLPSPELVQVQAADLLMFMLLTAFALTFAALLSEGELSPAHMIGIVAFLSQPPEVFHTMTWAVFIGGVVGVIVRSLRSYQIRRDVLNLPGILFVVSRVTLSFWASGQIYYVSGGSTPLGRLPVDISPTILPLTIYALVYITLYFSIFLLELYTEGYSVGRVVRSDLARIAVILILPLPFAVLGAEIFLELTLPSQVVLVAGLLLIIIALNLLSYSEYRLRKQLDEMRTLSIVTQAMRSHLNLEALLKTIYVHIAQLLNIDSFVVALQFPHDTSLHLPLIIHRGKEVHHESGAYSNVLIDYVLKTKQPHLIERDVETATASLGLKFTDRDVYSWLAVPLATAGNVFGVIAITSYDPKRLFTRDDLRLLNIVAASGSIAIENAQLYQEQTERAEQLVTLNRIGSLLTGTLSPDKVLDTVISSASAITNANAVSVYLFLDDTRSKLPLVKAVGLSDTFTFAAPPLISFSAFELQLVTVDDLRIEARSIAPRSILESEGVRAFVEMPLQVGEETLGALVFYYKTPQIFNSDKIELYKTFASQAAQAIKNARLYTTTDEALQRSVEQLLTLTSIGRVLTSTVDLETICDVVLTEVSNSIHVKTGVILLRDEETQHLNVVCQRGYKPFVDVETVLSSASIKKVLSGGVLLRVNDVRKDAEAIVLAPDTRSQLIVPILRAKDVIGIILLESEAANGFSEEDSHFVVQVATQAVIAIDNARLFDNITEARDRLRVLLDAMEEGIILLDKVGRVELANPAINLIGLQQAQLVNQNLLKMAEDNTFNINEKLGYSSSVELESLFQDLAIASPAVNYVVPAEHGLLHIRRQIIPIRATDGTSIGILMVFYNKTEEQELTRSRDEISRMIVHDLRSPLTAVTTSLRLLQEIIPKDTTYYPTVASTTDASRRAIRKVLHRVDSLLDVARMETGQLSIDADLVELRSLVEAVRSELAPLAQELHVTFEAKIDSNLPPLDVDSDKVERLILNLVDNALKYAPAESAVTVRNHSPGEDGAKAGYVRIDVVDQGPGVPADYKNTLFDRFVQIEGRRKVRRGVGLGLTFCRLVTEAHGGMIWIEDNPEGGSVFAFTLPLARMDALDE